jgi:hypothetical protein
MPLVGGGGSPNVAGSNPSGTGNTLQYVGKNFAYAYAGASEASNSTVTVLDFTTGPEIVKGQIFGSGTVNYNSGNLGDGKFTAWKISMDGQVIGFLKTDSQQEDMPNEAVMQILIPPFSHIEVEVLSSGSSASEFTTTSITGRVYYA